MNWISTNDLKQWADERQCQDTLPKLIARLIRASVTKISYLNFPSGDHVQYGGWDGVLISDEKTAYVPDGISLWESGAGKVVKKKLNDDFAKRTANPEGYDLSKSTFIFITPRPFKNKKKWIEEKKKLDIWHDIRIYDAEVIYQWIDSCPSVGLWLAVLIGKFPNDCTSIDSKWDVWSTGKEFNISPQLLLTDRQAQSQDLLNQYGQDKVIIVRGPSKSEAMAFIIATFLVQDDGGYNFVSRGLIAESSEIFLKLASHKISLNIIVDFEDLDSLHHASKKGHKIFVPIGDIYTNEDQGEITLPSMSRSGFEDALIQLGLPRYSAESYSRESSSSITILRRLQKFDLSQPTWAKDPNASDLVPILLLQGWNEAHLGDIQFIETISGISYDEYIKKINRFLILDDSPIIKLGTVWKLKSPLDSWTYLIKYLTKADLEMFVANWKNVLGEIDPKFTLDPEKRVFANLYGKGRRYSIVLRKGLCQTLIHFSLFDHTIVAKLGESTKQISAGLIGDLLSTDDPQLWMSIHDQMQLIAEAAPKVFIDSLETQLSLAETPIKDLFHEERGFLFPKSYLPGLLWAIESLTWFPEFFPQCCLVLARLAELDPGGSTMNRPINSLKEIFKPWHPGTYSSVQDRMEVLSLIYSRFPKTAWGLFISLLPSGYGHDLSMGTSKSKWLYLLMSPNTYEVETASRAFYDHVFDLLLKLTSNDAQKISELVRMSQTFPNIIRETVISEVTKNYSFIDDPQQLIWNELRSIVHEHTSHPNAKWALPQSEILKYSELRKLFDQQADVDSGVWLFEEYWPKLPDGFPSEFDTHEKQESYIKKLRFAFVQRLYDEQKIDGVLAYNEKLKNRMAFAEAILKLELNESEVKYLFLECKNSSKALDLAKRFAYLYDFSYSIDLLLGQHTDLLNKGVSEDTLVEIYASMKQGESLWSQIQSLGAEVYQKFWTMVEPHFIILSDAEIQSATEILLQHGRPFTALSEVTHHLPKISTHLLEKILMQCSEGPAMESPFMDEYNLRSAFEELHSRTDIESETIVRLEWQYLPLLMRSGRDNINLEMKNQICRNSRFFNTIMEVLYDQDSTSKLTQIQLENRYRFLLACDEVLNSINTVPGQNADHSIDRTVLREWLDQTRQEAIDKNRIDKVDFRIGRILGNFCKDNHSSSGPIYEYLEEIKSVKLSDGFSAGVMSSGKSTWRAIDAGGKIEWNKYGEVLEKTKELRTTYPYVASLYSDIGDYYKEKAEREDREVLYRKLDED